MKMQIPRVSLTKSLQRLLAYLLLATLLVLALGGYVLTHDPSTTHHSSIRFNLRSFDKGYNSDQGESLITDVKVVNCRTFWSCRAPLKHGSQDQGVWYLINKPLSYSKSLLRPSSIFNQKFIFVEKTPIVALSPGKDQLITDLNIYSHRMITYDLEPYDPKDLERYYYDLDLVYGSDSVEVRPGWTRLDKPFYPEVSAQAKEMPVYLTMRKEPVASSPSVIKLEREGVKYKVLQVADLHYSTGVGTCRDQYPFVEDCQADPRTKAFVERVLDYEKPDLVALTGDQVFGEDSFDTQTTIMKVVEPFIRKQIPYLFTFGNHDDEGSLTRLEIFQLLQTLPFFVGPEEGTITGVHGVGNMVTQVFDTTNNNPLLTIYLLDSHKYTPNQKLYPGYDWVKESQLHYIQLEQAKLPQPESSKNHTSLAFLHIPLPEYRHITTYPISVGSYKEGITAPFYNSGARDVFKALGVAIVSVGHDHCNDFCMNDDGVWLCYGGAVGEGGYAGYGGTERRLRVWEFAWEDQKEEEERGVIGRTWKWLETDLDMKRRFDESVVVQGGVAV